MIEHYVPLSPEVIQHPGVSANAKVLYSILVSNQTSPDGAVFYGKSIGYAWIRSRWNGAPTIRTIQRYMRELKDAELVMVRRDFRGGMRLWLPKSVKFPNAIPAPAEQLSLLSPVAVMKKQAVENPVEMQRESSEPPDFNNDKFVAMGTTRLSSERSRK